MVTASGERVIGGVMAIVVGSLALVGTTRVGAVNPGAHADNSNTCPGLSCPYVAPTGTEQSFANDILARMNIERSQSPRGYPLGGVMTPLAALSEDPDLEETAQAAAEYDATQKSEQDYVGTLPGSDTADGGTAFGPVIDSAGVDLGFMKSWLHAVAILSAAPDFAGIGVSCDSSGQAWVVELFANADLTSWQSGQSRVNAELAANNEYVASGGTVSTVTDVTGDGTLTLDAHDVFPQDPIAAGSEYATGVDWTCHGPSYQPGTVPVDPLPAPVSGIAPSPDGGGYVLANSAGAVSVHGDATFHGGANGLALNQPIDRIIETSDGGGYWMIAQDGGVFAFGDAKFYGSMAGEPLNAPVVDLAPTTDGKGYWLVAADGGVFAFGDAAFLGSMGGQPLNAPVLAIRCATTASGATGYWLAAADGGVFAFGDAPFLGSMGGKPLNRPVVGIAPSQGANGYWLAATDGGVFAFGDAPFLGSMGGKPLNQPVIGIAADGAEPGYWLVASDGGVFALGAPYFGAD